MQFIKKIPIEHLHQSSDLEPLLKAINQVTGRSNSAKIPAHPSYEALIRDNIKVDLLKQLRRETYGLCCFCQRQVNGEKIEHFLPQGTKTKLFTNEEVDYYNLFYCCHGRSQQCSDAKGNMLIGKFITDPRCETFFKYVPLGEEVEILPNNKEYNSWVDFEENLAQLKPMEQQAFITIKVLGLNNKILVMDRYKALKEEGLLKKLKDNKGDISSLENLKKKYLPENLSKNQSLPAFSGMFLYFINEQISKLPTR